MEEENRGGGEGKGGEEKAEVREGREQKEEGAQTGRLC